jgi:hypothetical protein
MVILFQIKTDLFTVNSQVSGHLRHREFFTLFGGGCLCKFLPANPKYAGGREGKAGKKLVTLIFSLSQHTPS